MSTTRTMTPEQLQLACRYLSFTHTGTASPGIQAAIAYLTTDKSQPELAKAHGITRQRVSYGVKQLKEAHDNSQELLRLFRLAASPANRFAIALLLTNGSHQTATLKACRAVLVDSEPVELAAQKYTISPKTVYGGLAALERRYQKAGELHQVLLA